MPAIELMTENADDRIALRGVRVKARIAALSVHATIEQTFVNLEDRAIEAVYTFPLPEGAAVCGFEVITGDRVLTGRIEETDEAIKQYDDAIESGHGAFALEADRPDIFTVRVGNLKPRQAATIRISYVAALDRVDRSIRVAFPTTVAPRYSTMSGMNPIDAEIEADAVNPPHVWQVPYGVSMEVEVELQQKVRSITSPTHALAVDQTASPGASILTLNSTAMDRDIVLAIELEKEHSPSAELVKDDKGQQFIAVTFVPEFEVEALAEPAASETVFVLDCSGSMQGESISQATLALELCLRALGPGDFFNICRFGSTFEMLSSEPLRYSGETLARAIAYVQREADLGGTELLAPLQAVFATQPRTAMRNIVLLTDGQVSNEAAVLELARTNRRNHRIFSFGIGTACSAYLVKGLARATGGAAEFITGSERIDEKVLRTFSRIASPMLTNVHIDWDGAEVMTLAELPPVFDGELMTVFGKVAGERVPSRIALRGELSSQEISWTIHVPAAREDSGKLISLLWARRMIQSIEEVNSITRSAARSNETRERRLLIEISQEYGLLSALTTFVAIEHRTVEERNEGKPELRRVPVQLANRWGDIGGSQMLAACAPMMAMPSAPQQGLMSRVGSLFKGRGSSRKSMYVPSADSQLFDDSSSVPPPNPLLALLRLQQAEGYFLPDPMMDELLAAAGLHWDEEWVKGEKDPRVQATAKVLRILRSHFALHESTWLRAAVKAQRWLAKALNLKPSELQQLLRG